MPESTPSTERQHPHPSRASHDPTSPIKGEVSVDCFFEEGCAAEQDKAHTSPLVGEVDSSVAKNRVGGSLSTASTTKQKSIRIALVLIALLLLGGGLLAFRSMNLAEAAWLPKCLYHQLTGLHCPGCGITRALQALAQGNIPQAFAYNALWPVVLLLALPYLLKKTWYWMLGTRPAVGKSRAGLYVLLGALLGVVVVMFAILRNLPGEPWRQLAPHELP